MIKRAIPALFFAAMTLEASAAVLTFDGDICNGGGACGNASAIDQSYGDSALVDVIWDSTPGGEPTNLLYWLGDYSDLSGVAYGDLSGAEVFLSPVAGASVTLNSFDLGAWPNTDRNSEWSVLDGLGNVLLSSGPITISGTEALNVVVGLTSNTGLRIQFGPDAFNVGIDNIDFTVQPIPLPGALLMMLSGVGLLGAARRRVASR